MNRLVGNILILQRAYVNGENKWIRISESHLQVDFLNYLVGKSGDARYSAEFIY